MQPRRVNTERVAPATLRKRKAALARRRRRRRQRIYSICILLCAVFMILGCSAWLLFGQKEVQSVDATDVPLIEHETATTYTIVLDSGHSTYNVGAHGLVKEEEITAQTTEKLRQLLEENEHFEVILTHEYDVHASVAERREVGIASDCDFFLSIHCNSYGDDSSIQGFEVYAQLPENAMHTESYAMATSIAQKFIDAGHNPRTGSGVFYCRYVPDENGEDVRYTLTEQEEADTDLGGTTYGVIKSDEYPAVLIEQGYVNNAQDVANWMSDDGTQAAAEIYYQALCEYFGVTENI